MAIHMRNGESGYPPLGGVVIGWVKALDLQSHPEGGFYSETFRSAGQWSADQLPVGFGGARSWLTSIFFLLAPGRISRFHRLRSDEIWYYQAGLPLTIHVLFPDGSYRAWPLGMEISMGQYPQRAIPAGCWFGATFDHIEGFGLAGCAVSPGFSFADFEMAEAHELLGRFSAHEEIIRKLAPSP